MIDSDSELIKFLKTELVKAAFISNESKATIEGMTDKEMHLQSDSTSKLWIQLLHDAIVFLKSRDERETYHDNMTLGLEKLYTFLDVYKDFEPMMYGAYENYRDHVTHAMRVMLLGDSVIRSAFRFENIATPLENELVISADEKEAMWIIIALTHDLGLPLEVIRRISDRVRKMLYEFGMVSVEEMTSGYFSQYANLSDFVIRFVSSDVKNRDEIEKKKAQEKQEGKKATDPKEEKVAENSRFVLHIQAKYYQKFLSALSRFNHGVVSAIILMKDLVFFKESEFMLDNFKFLDGEDARQFLIRNQILRAIASHSCEDIYHLTIANFSFILTACDEMQEWGRPRLVDVTKRAGSAPVLLIKEINKKVVDYTIRFSFPTGAPPSEEEKTRVSNEISGYFETKCGKWLNVLRSAVSPNRDIELRFAVVDETYKPTIKEYSLVHKNPMDVKIEPAEMKAKIMKGPA
jgi:hypothetical protein